MRLLALAPTLLFCVAAHGAGPYSPPSTAASAVAGVAFDGEKVGQKFRTRFSECDLSNTCDGKPQKYGCSKDLNQNSTLLKLKNGVIFYDAKMGLDADGSPFSKKTPGQTDQPQTSLRYPLPGKPSVNADRVPFVVIPQGGFDQALGVKVGDVAAVVRGGNRVYAVVADKGPVCKIGEGSIQLHESLGHTVCKQRDAVGDCVKLTNAGIDRDVLYFIFPSTSQALLPGLTPENISSRIQTIGSQEWQRLIAH